MTRARVLLVDVGAVAAIGAVALVTMAAGDVHAPPRPVVEAGSSVAGNSPGTAGAGTEGLPDHARSRAVRAIAPEVVAPPEIAGQELRRVDARPPLGELGLAARPKSVRPEDWDGTLLYRPTVTSSASFEAMGYSIFIAGTEPVGPRQTCEYGGAVWACGERAMLAFRYWLRGRAPLCQVFPGVERQPVAAQCRVGKQDVGAWLVSNGWALARPGSGYEAAEDVARHAAMGIFGPPE